MHQEAKERERQNGQSSHDLKHRKKQGSKLETQWQISKQAGGYVHLVPDICRIASLENKCFQKRYDRSCQKYCSSLLTTSVFRRHSYKLIRQ